MKHSEEMGNFAPRCRSWSAADALLAVLPAVTGLVLWAPVLEQGLSLGDEGWLISGASRIVEGEVLYRDVFRSYGPGIFHSCAWLLRGFGEDVLVARWGWLGLLASLAGLSFLVARRLLPRGSAVMVALIPVVIRAPYYKAFVPLSLVAGLALVFPLIRERLRRSTCWWVGAGIGALAMFRQEVAAYSLLIGLASLALARLAPNSPDSSRPRLVSTALSLFGGVALVWVPFLVWLTIDGALLPALQQLTTAGVRGNVQMTLPFPEFTRIWRGPERLESSALYFPTAAVLGAVAVTATSWLRRQWGERELCLLQWLAMGLLAHSVFLVRPDYSHAIQVFVLSGMLMAVSIHALWGTVGSRLRRVLGKLLAVGLSLWLLAFFPHAFEKKVRPPYGRMKNAVALEEPRASVRLPPRSAKTLRTVLEEIRASSADGEPILVGPHLSMLHFLADRPHPTPYDNLLPGFLGPGVEQSLVESLSAVNLVVINHKAWDGREEQRFLNYALDFAAALYRDFESHRKLEDYEFFLRRGHTPVDSSSPARPKKERRRKRSGN